MNSKQKELMSMSVDAKPQMALDIFAMAREFHDTYEEEAKRFNWNTQSSCKVPFDDLPTENKTVMLRTCARLIEWLANKDGTK